MRHSTALLPLVTLLLIPPPARADDVQVPFDQTGKVQELKGAQARAWGVLAEYPALKEARLYQDTATGAYTLEVTEEREAQTIRRRVSLPENSVESLRRRVSDAQDAPAGPTLNQEGRWVLVALSTVMGASYYGITMALLPNYITPPSPTTSYEAVSRASFSLYALTTAASFFVPMLVTMNQEVTWGTTAAFYAGITRGIGHGLLLGTSVLDQSGGYYSEPLLLMGAAAGLVEGIGSAYWVAKNGLSTGLVQSAMTGTDFGAAYGLGFYLLAGGLGATQGELAPRLAAASTLLGSLGGTLGGYLWGQKRGYTWGAAEAIRTSGLLGMFVTVPVLVWTESSDPRLVSGLMLAGSSLGLAVGDHLFADRGYDVGSALLLDLSVVAGGLVGFGAAAMSFMSGSNPGPTQTLVALGAVGGYVLTYFVLPPGPPAPRAGAPTVHLQVDPVAVAMQVPGTERIPGLGALGRPSATSDHGHLGATLPPPAVSLSGQF
jgi:hypothetical protein